MHPHLIRDTWNRDFRWHFIRPDSILEEYYTRIFTQYVEMGFRKFKLDIAYGVKSEMKQLLSMIYGIIKKLDSTIEVECHVPDIFGQTATDIFVGCIREWYEQLLATRLSN